MFLCRKRIPHTSTQRLYKRPSHYGDGRISGKVYCYKVVLHSNSRASYAPPVLPTFLKTSHKISIHSNILAVDEHDCAWLVNSAKESDSGEFTLKVSNCFRVASALKFQLVTRNAEGNVWLHKWTYRVSWHSHFIVESPKTYLWGISCKLINKINMIFKFLI